jgi:salicylate hydroxylase
MRVVIVGGGIGGLAAALFLRRVGLDAIVYEQAQEAREVGAGIVVAPNMVRLMARLDLADDLEWFAVKLEAAWEFRRWQDGRVLSVQPMGEVCKQQYSAHCYVAHRADLLALLQRALPQEVVHLDQRCIAIR